MEDTCGRKKFLTLFIKCVDVSVKEETMYEKVRHCNSLDFSYVLCTEDSEGHVENSFEFRLFSQNSEKKVK